MNSRSAIPPEADRTSGSAGVQSVEVGLKVLLALAEGGGELTLSEIASLAQMPPAKAHRYLTSLGRAGFVERSDRSNLYLLGGSAVRLGMMALARLDIAEAAEDELRRFRDRFGLAVTLNLWGSHGPIVVRMIESLRPVAVGIRLGWTVPLLQTAGGLVFAAFSSPGLVNPLIDQEIEEYRDRGITLSTRQEIDRRLATIRERGIERVRNGNIAPGVTAIAAPIFKQGNELAGVVAVLGSIGSFDESLDGEVAQNLIETVNNISMRLGGRASHADLSEGRGSES